MTSSQPKGIIIPIASENLQFEVKKKALATPLGQDGGTANFPYQILLVKFHLQYRNDNCVGSRGDLSIVNKNSWEC